MNVSRSSSPGTSRGFPYRDKPVACRPQQIFFLVVVIFFFLTTTCPSTTVFLVSFTLVSRSTSVLPNCWLSLLFISLTRFHTSFLCFWASPPRSFYSLELLISIVHSGSLPRVARSFPTLFPIPFCRIFSITRSLLQLNFFFDVIEIWR